MNRNLKILLAIILVIGVSSQKEVREYLGFREAKVQICPTVAEQDTLLNETPQLADLGNYFVSDTVYEWSDLEADWIPVDDVEDLSMAQLVSSFTIDEDEKPVSIDWKLLMNIKYKLKYYKEIDAEMYAPIFSKTLKALDGKEVIIKGYVMPIDEETDLKALSANPYSSCFFCGKASPASVMSLYLKKNKTYKLDAYKKFRGTLHLNYDDPDEFYYVLKNAVSVK